MKRFMLFLLATLCLLSGGLPADVQAAEGDIQMSYKDHLLTIRAQQADIKNILLRISDETGIFVRFPNDISKQISIAIVDTPLAKALKKLLRGLNHAIIYSPPNKKQAPRVDQVYVFQEAKGGSARSYARSYNTSNNTSNGQQQSIVERRIQSYEKRIQFLKERLSRVDADSTQGKRYTQQIESYQKHLERLRQNQ